MISKFDGAEIPAHPAIVELHAIIDSMADDESIKRQALELGNWIRKWVMTSRVETMGGPGSEKYEREHAYVACGSQAAKDGCYPIAPRGAFDLPDRKSLGHCWLMTFLRRPSEPG